MQLQFLWRPYEIPAIISCVPSHVGDERAVCSAVTALVCFEAVEWHPSNRVTRQFGIYQLIPPDPMNLGESQPRFEGKNRLELDTDTSMLD